jgi:hypothetical protein
MAKQDIELNLSEVLIHLRDSGAFRRAVMEVAEKKAGGTEIGNITLRRAGGELPDADLDAVTGGALPTTTTVPLTSQLQYQAPSLSGFADTTW